MTYADLPDDELIHLFELCFDDMPFHPGVTIKRRAGLTGEHIAIYASLQSTPPVKAVLWLHPASGAIWSEIDQEYDIVKRVWAIITQCQKLGIHYD